MNPLALLTLTLALLFGSPSPATAQTHCPDDGIAIGAEGYCHTPHNHTTYKALFRSINADLLQGVGDADFNAVYERLQLQLAAADGDEELGPGDSGFMSAELDALYRLLYSSSKCNCKYKSCRPTTVRVAKPGEDDVLEEARSGWMVLIDGKWYPVPKGSLFHEADVDPEVWYSLTKDLDGVLNSHVCAFWSGERLINECTMVPKIHG